MQQLHFSFVENQFDSRDRSLPPNNINNIINKKNKNKEEGKELEGERKR